MEKNLFTTLLVSSIISAVVMTLLDLQYSYWPKFFIAIVVYAACYALIYMLFKIFSSKANKED